MVGNRFSTIASWLCQPWGTPDLALFGSHSSGLGIEHRFFCLIPYSFRNFFLPNLGFFYQLVEPVQHHSWLTLSAMKNTWLCFVWFSLIRARNWAPLIFFIIPYSFRSLLKKFGNFSQQVVTVEKWFNLFCKRTLGSPQFWHFSSPNPLGLKPIDYEGLVSHIEGLSQCLVSVSVGPFWSYGRCGLGKSSLIRMTFGESLTLFQQAFFLFGTKFDAWFWIHVAWLTHPLL